MPRAALVLASFCVLTSACTQSFQTEFVLINEDWNPIHLWVTGEEMSKSNRVGPQGQREKVLHETEPGNYNYSVFVGRDDVTHIQYQFDVQFEADCRQVHQVIAAYGAFGSLDVDINRDIERECDEDAE